VIKISPRKTEQPRLLVQAMEKTQAAHFAVSTESTYVELSVNGNVTVSN